jgi:hypothetical protein
LAQSKKIYQVTEDFIEAFWILKEQGKMPKHEELVKIMGINSISGLSSILKKRHNIQTEQWQKFKDHFGIEESSESLSILKEEPAPPYKTEPPTHTYTNESIYLPEIMRVLKKQGEALDLIVVSLKELATTQKKILEQLKPKAGKPPKK